MNWQRDDLQANDSAHFTNGFQISRSTASSQRANGTRCTGQHCDKRVAASGCDFPLGAFTTFPCGAHPPSQSYCSSRKRCYSFIDLCFLNYKHISILLQVVFTHHSDWSFPCSKTSSISWPENYYYLFQRKLTVFDVCEGWQCEPQKTQLLLHTFEIRVIGGRSVA